MVGRPELRLWAGRSPLANALNLALIGWVTWNVTAETPLGISETHLANIVLLGVAALAWLSWLVLRLLGSGPVPTVAVLVVMAAAGGGLVVSAPVAIVFPAVASLGAALAMAFSTALFVPAAGALAMVASAVVTSGPYGSVYGGLAACCGGIVFGLGRKQAEERAQQAALIGVEKDRADIEQARAELLAERNHLARELHDVLAHTLSALSLQLEAFDTLVESDPTAGPEVRAGVERLRTLVHEGLLEARGAVRALREDAAPLPEQLTRLCDEHDVELSVEGEARTLPAQTSLSLYRIAQEAVTNAMKHAPGAPVTARLCFTPDSVRLEVRNGLATGGAPALQASGGGYGLQGIAERLALVGGSLEAGPTTEGWRVCAEVPVAP